MEDEQLGFDSRLYKTLPTPCPVRHTFPLSDNVEGGCRSNSGIPPVQMFRSRRQCVLPASMKTSRESITLDVYMACMQDAS